MQRINLQVQETRKKSICDRDVLVLGKAALREQLSGLNPEVALEALGKGLIFPPKYP